MSACNFTSMTCINKQNSSSFSLSVKTNQALLSLVLVLLQFEIGKLLVWFGFMTLKIENYSKDSKKEVSK